MTFKELIENGGHVNFYKKNGLLVYAMLKKRFPRLGDSELAITENDVLSETMFIILEKYSDKQVSEVEKLWFTLAKNYTLNFFAKGIQKFGIPYDSEIHSGIMFTYNKVEQVIADEEWQHIISLKDLNDKERFILKFYKELEMEHGYNQLKVVKEIQEEYLNLFKVILTLDNYRTLKKRGLDKVKSAIG